MTEFRYNKILLVIIIIGLIAALTVVGQRHHVEENNSCVELVIDYEDIVELAQLEGVPLHDLMREFKGAGITSLAVYDMTLEKLNKSGKVTAVSGADILHGYRAGTLSAAVWRNMVESGRISSDEVYVIGQDRAVFGEVREDIIRRLGADRVTDLQVDNLPVVAVKANFEKFLKGNLGLPSDEMRDVASQGFYLVPRPTNYTKVTAADVEAVFGRLAKFDNVSAMMFVGEETLGYPDQLPVTVARLKEQNITLAMIEHPLQLQFFKQEGLTQIATALGYQAARTYVIPKDEQPKLKIAEAVQRWTNTDQERNIRINLLRKYEKPESGKTLIETNINYITDVRDGLLAKNFTIGRAGTYAPYFPSPFLLALIFLGATAAGVLFLTLVYPFALRYQYILLVILAAVLVFPLLKGGGTLMRQAVATVSAIVFPVLAMTWQLDRWRQRQPQPGGSLLKIIVDGIGGLIITVLLSMVGGMYVAAVLGDVRFLLEMEIFRGVKLTFIMPLVLISIVYMTRYNLFASAETAQKRSVWSQVVNILDYPIYVKSLFVFAAAAVAAWVFVGRSGHTAGVPVPEIELKFRAFLEQAMYARPREKEFMIGHPAFFLAVMALYRQWPKAVHYAMVVIATIAQGSLVETFAHLRTPVFMSFIRGVDGMALGIVFGIIAVVGVQVLHYLSYLMGRRPVDHE